MIKFFSFLELARLEGISNMKNRAVNLVPPERINFAALEDVHPFLFSCDAAHGEPSIDIDLDAVEVGDLPFSACSFELAGKSIRFSEVNVGCLVVFECSPKNYDFFVLGINRENNKGRVCQVDQIIGAPILDFFLRRLYQEKTGVESIRTRVKLGVGKNKKIKQFSQIIHVSPIKYSGGPSGEVGRKVDWSHRFEVRGHWRRVGGIGKDRSGAPVNSGFTWVRSYQKGAEHLPLIKKARLVSVKHGDKEPDNE